VTTTQATPFVCRVSESRNSCSNAFASSTSHLPHLALQNRYLLTRQRESLASNDRFCNYIHISRLLFSATSPS